MGQTYTDNGDGEKEVREEVHEEKDVTRTESPVSDSDGGDSGDTDSTDDTDAQHVGDSTSDNPDEE